MINHQELTSKTRINSSKTLGSFFFTFENQIALCFKTSSHAVTLEMYDVFELYTWRCMQHDMTYLSFLYKTVKMIF